MASKTRPYCGASYTSFRTTSPVPSARRKAFFQVSDVEQVTVADEATESVPSQSEATLATEEHKVVQFPGAEPLAPSEAGPAEPHAAYDALDQAAAENVEEDFRRYTKPCGESVDPE